MFLANFGFFETFSSFFQDWHRHVDVEKSVLPKILKLLNGASYFLAGIYPRLLPLMHKMPRRIFEADFVTKFLSAIRSGIYKIPWERSICLKYLTYQRPKNVLPSYHKSYVYPMYAVTLSKSFWQHILDIYLLSTNIPSFLALNQLFLCLLKGSRKKSIYKNAFTSRPPDFHFCQTKHHTTTASRQSGIWRPIVRASLFRGRVLCA